MRGEKNTDRLLSTEEVAERLNVSPLTVRKWLRSGRLRGIKVSVLWRVRESDLNAFIKAFNDEKRSG